ncbi:hypothetical protein Q9K01_05270 [Qipengyuania sp. DY56-A-20]|uniref:site-specific DNA-methyltransferase (adenine-specific) n=2 Tax=Qipengyuania benthica TaxID=3067651 RepID=A0ABT9H730_9SPHN|nr:hypothetical protein [Qipengyuania sp. DY56-A-20]
MDDLLREDVQSRLRAIWTDPPSLDPAKISAEVTEDIAKRLAKVARSLEKRHDPKDIAEFLMRCLFTMFAEDVGLLPDSGFEKLLEQMVETPENFAPALESLWRVMDEGGYAPHLNATIKRFNGSLFKTRTALKLEADDIRELWLASRKDWRDVEPAIFGTLLERALDTKERGKLGAHFTPRVYVERLVVPTIIEPLREDWDEVKALVTELQKQGNYEAAIEAVRDFHHRLCTTRVLDPACGTGNFLYVSLELMKRLEGEILETLEALGDDEARLLLDGETVNPRQFYGLEINPRAVPIADLVLWIGFLKWQLRTVEVKDLPEPILHAYGTIKHQDALIAYDSMEMLRDQQGKPLSRWDGETMKRHPITGEEIPDPDATMELYEYVNPRRAEWPQVEFIVGNPPFIQGTDMRAELGDGYAEAAWKVRKDVPGGADFVMHFWDEAATRLLAKPPKGAKGENPLRRFGFITTNSITQTFSRRVVERHMNAKLPLSLVYAIPDHPWLKASDKAAVRIAMTVAVRGERQGKLAKVEHESALSSDTPEVRLEIDEGKISPKIRLGANLSLLESLISNEQISYQGIKLHGAGFIVTASQASALEGRSDISPDRIIRPFLNGMDLTRRSRKAWVIDASLLEEEELQQEYPEIYQYLSNHVRPERMQNRRDVRRRYWWKFGEIGATFRPALETLIKFIATTRTAKHRTFSFVESATVPESGLVVFNLFTGLSLAILNSRAHVHFALSNGAFLEDRPSYHNTQTFVP